MTAKNLKDGEFKQTEVGYIPTDWNVVSLSAVASKITDGTHDTPQQTKDGKPFLTAIHVKENRIDFDNCYFVSEEVHKEIFRRCNPESGDILMVNIGAGTATTAVVNVPYEFSLKNVALIKPDLKNNGLYINYALQFARNKTLESLATGGAQPFLSLSQIARLIIARPTKQEQTAIANALSDVDALIQELEKLIAKKQAIKTATMQQLLSGRTRLPQFAHHPDGSKKGYKPSAIGNIPEDWDVRPLSDLSTYINDGTHHTPKYVQQGVPFYSVENVTANDFTNVKYISLEEHKKLIRRCLPETGDILMTRIGTLGITRFIDWDVDASIYVSLALIKLKSVVDSKYVYIFSKSEIFSKEVEKRSLVNATPQKINMNEIGKVPIAFPTDKEEQSKISIILSDVLSEIQILENRLNKTHQIKQGMMQELLTGKTRLVKPAGAA